MPNISKKIYYKIGKIKTSKYSLIIKTLMRNFHALCKNKDI